MFTVLLLIVHITFTILVVNTSIHISVHFKLLARHVHSGNLHDHAHLQESNCNTASNAGELLIRSMASCPLSSVVIQFLLELQAAPPN